MMLLISKLVFKLPLNVALVLGRLLGLFFYYVLPFRRKVAFRNVERVFGNEKSEREKRRIVRCCYAQLGMYGMELLRLPYFTPELSDELIERRGFEHLEAAFARGKGVIIVSAHMDNVDYAGCSMAIKGIPICVAAKDIHWKPAREFISRIRMKTGVILIPAQRSKEQVCELLKQNKAVSLIVDQHMAKYRAIVCEFFGAPASTSPSPARFAYETGAVIVPGIIYRKGNSGRHVLRFNQPFELESISSDRQLNIRHNTERLNRIIEDWIREFPEQWLWLHNRWKVHRDPEAWDIPDNLKHLLRPENQR
jgi:Kdo2-lipid IVA lauroyltransferase/acyltransferase